MIRAFIEVGGLSVTSARAVLAAVDDESLPFGVAIGIAATSLPNGSARGIPIVPADSGRGERELTALVAERGWIVADLQSVSESSGPAEMTETVVVGTGHLATNPQTPKEDL